MKIGVGTFVGVAVLFLPISVSAQVVINEFLYDAQGTDTDQEYIELHNTGSSPVDLTKYKINDGSNHTLNVPPKNGGAGSISIAPSGYALLVDNAANFIAAHPGVGGTVIDTVLSLSNTGTTLSLLDESGTVVSTVSYTKDQGAAGDGNSLQRSDGSWIAAAPTPGAKNATVAAPPADTSAAADAAATPTEVTETAPSSASTAVSSYVPPPEPTLFADAGANRTVIVGADTTFYGRAYNRKKEDVDHVRFLWNFGDGSTAEGPSVMHHYEYPGKYAAVLTIAEQRTAVDAHVIVTAEPARLSFSTQPDGSVSIGNLAGRDLDLSGWMIRSFGRTFTLPGHSMVLSGQSLRISQKTLNFFSGLETELDYPNGVLALTAGTSTASSLTAPAPVIASVSVAEIPHPVASAPIDIPEPTPASEQSTESDAPAASSGSLSSAQAASAAGASGGGGYWWLGALGLAGALGAGTVAVRRMKKSEWDIEETN
ncbi:MAG: lamin tail domain-containing protein [Candidatus Paceibacterota bacterium]